MHKKRKSLSNFGWNEKREPENRPSHSLFRQYPDGIENPNLLLLGQAANGCGKLRHDAFIGVLHHILQQRVRGDAQRVGNPHKGVQLRRFHTPFDDAHVGRTDVHNFSQLFLRQMCPIFGCLNSASDC